MAQRRLIRTGDGTLGRPGALATHQEALPKTVNALLGHIQDIIDTLNGQISLGTGLQSSLAGNVNAQYVDWVFPATPNTEQQIPHSLGRVPIGYKRVRADRACDVYDSSPGSWGKDTFFLKCDTANAQVKLLVW